jgi:hypothetical protein
MKNIFLRVLGAIADGALAIIAGASDLLTFVFGIMYIGKIGI